LWFLRALCATGNFENNDTMISFTATLKRFDTKGEKTGWTYIEIPADIAKKIKAGQKTSFRVKGKLDAYKITGVSLLPMGGGAFIIPVNASMRKGIGKRYGAMVKVQLEEDKAPFKFNKDFMDCLADEPAANEFFQTLTGSHQRYFSKWIDSAKTIETKAKRIAQAVTALSRKMGYPGMIRSNQKKNIDEF
jgi:hypothetical protein